MTAPPRVAALVLSVVLVAVLPAAAPADDRVSAFVHFSAGSTYDAGVAATQRAGLRVVADLPAAHAVYAAGSRSLLRDLAADPAVNHVEADGRVSLALDTAGDASRARRVYQEGSALRDPAGNVIDGHGVGIAVIDSGIDATHPDLQSTADGSAKVVRNFKVLCSPPLVGTVACRDELRLVEMEDTDTTEGHGTGVAGTAAGSGAASSGAFTGIAPGAQLYGFGAGDALQGLPVANIAVAYQWIYDHGAEQDPPIRVLNNSWASFGPFDPDSVIAKLTTAVVADRRVTVVFAGGNSGGDGATDETNAHGKNPLPGVLQVANYDDDDRGTRDGALARGSSRGDADDPRTWPDVAAPGTDITAPCKAVAIFCTFNLVADSAPYYARSSGTSYAAPHVAGVAALLYQTDAGITPAEIEDLLEDTAYAFTSGGAYAADPFNDDSLSSYDKGHGLVDALAAVESLLHADQPGG